MGTSGRSKRRQQQEQGEQQERKEKKTKERRLHFSHSGSLIDNHINRLTSAARYSIPLDIVVSSVRLSYQYEGVNPCRWLRHSPQAADVVGAKTIGRLRE